MLNNQMKLLFSAFIVILLGVVLIQSIADDVETAATSTVDVLNESISLTVVTADIINETLTFTDTTETISNETVTLSTGPPGNLTGTLANGNVTVLTALRNITSDVITENCSIILASGTLWCNHTSSSTIYADYTYVNGKTATLANNYVTTLTNLVNVTETDNLLGWCNLTHVTGVLLCNNTRSTTAYANYTFNRSSTGQLSSSYDEWTSFDACRNSTGTAILAGTHCNVSLTTGAVTTIYDNFTDNLAYIDYKYEPDTYVHSGTARTLLTITVLFFALAILGIGIGFAVKSFKDSGVM